MDLGPVQTDRSQFQHTSLLRQQEDLHEEVLQFGQEGVPKRRQGIMVGMLIAIYEAEGYRLIDGSSILRELNIPVAFHRLKCSLHAHAYTTTQTGPRHRLHIRLGTVVTKSLPE
ncbi:MAG TPA: hypothetical protein VNE61_08320 [Ktedonobacteraceae bacterium]|nr:hypothetical protein [Ktedonobacteraceae bacterium]